MNWNSITGKMPHANVEVRVMSQSGIISRGIWKRPYWYGPNGEWPAPFVDVQFWQAVPADIAAEEKEWANV